MTIALRTCKLLHVGSGRLYMICDDGENSRAESDYDPSLGEVTNHFNVMQKMCREKGWVPAQRGGSYKHSYYWLVDLEAGDE